MTLYMDSMPPVTTPLIRKLAQLISNRLELRRRSANRTQLLTSVVKSMKSIRTIKNKRFSELRVEKKRFAREKMTLPLRVRLNI